MKKSLIALAVAGAMTAPMVAQADATLYGSFRMGLSFQDGEDANLRDESSRIGIKGDVDLGLENTKGLFHWEANVNTTDSANYGEMFGERLAYMGATGNWGTALVGRQHHPHYTMVVSHTNIFNSADGEFGEAFVLGNTYHKRSDNTLAYASPVMGGFQVVAGAVIDSEGNSDNSGNWDEEVDGYNIAAQFTGVEGLRVSASYGDVGTNASANIGQVDANGDAVATPFVGVDSEVWGLGATYTIDAFTVAARYEEREDNGTHRRLGYAESTDSEAWEIAGIYQMGDTALKARYGDMEVDRVSTRANRTTSVDGDQWGVEVEQKLGQRGRVWVGYTEFDEEIAAYNGDAEDTLIIGYRLDF